MTVLVWISGGTEAPAEIVKAPREIANAAPTTIFPVRIFIMRLLGLPKETAITIPPNEYQGFRPLNELFSNYRLRPRKHLPKVLSASTTL
jgi:hypothetical protein